MARKRSSPLAVEYLQGIHLVDSVLWFDAPRKADLCFLSHAHLDSPFGHEKVFTSEATAALAARYLDSHRTLVCPMLRSFALGGFDLSLHPSGHMLGASQLMVRRDQERLIYTGHFDLSHRRSCHQGRVLECEHLVIHAQHTGALPQRERQEAALVEWSAQELSHGRSPVLLCQAPGTAQELAALLTERELPHRHLRSLATQFKAYRSLEADAGRGSAYRGRAKQAQVIIAPHRAQDSRVLQGMEAPSLALVCGKAPRKMPAGAKSHFALSSHADAPALLRYARQSKARRITLLGPAAEALAEQLRAEGHKAWPLQVPKQLRLI